MILTCPACDTKYVVKDDAIPPGGRQVRCASCKHSWHQDSEMAAAEPATAAEIDVEIDLGAPPPPLPQASEEPLADVPEQFESEGEIAGEPQPPVDDDGQSAWGAVNEEPAVTEGPADEPEVEEPAVEQPGPDEVAMEEAPAIADVWRPHAPVVEEEPAIADEWQPRVPVEQEPIAPVEEEFVGYAPIAGDDEQPRSRWPLIIGILVLIAAAAAAFWFFAPPEWKERAGIAQAGATPLQLMITTSDRQPLESGNELVSIGGRVINPTDEEQKVPPIRAELRDKQTKALVHRWTIAPPARVLAPRSSASFNSAEVDVPKGGDELTVTLGG